MILVAFLIVCLLLAAATGRLADSRDTDHRLWPLAKPEPCADPIPTPDP